MNLIALLPKDRTQRGKLQLWRDGSLIQVFDVLGKSDNETARKRNNTSRNPLLPFGDTPVGTWKVAVGPIKSDHKTYGHNPVLMLWPTGGPALVSHDAAHRRTGIWLHGGDTNALGNLRPTFGCLRVHNETMARLHELSKQHGQITTLETKEV